MFSIFITHHSKIRDLSDENNNWKQNSNKPISHGSHHFWVIDDGNRVMRYGNMKFKHPFNNAVNVSLGFKVWSHPLIRIWIFFNSWIHQDGGYILLCVFSKFLPLQPSRTMKHGCVSGLGCRCKIRQFLKK